MHLLLERRHSRGSRDSVAHYFLVFRIQLDHSRVIYRSASDGGRWRPGRQDGSLTAGVNQSNLHRKIQKEASKDSSSGWPS